MNIPRRVYSLHIGTLGLTLIGRAGGNGAKPNLLASAPRVAPSLKHEKRVLGLTQVGRYVGRQVGLRVNPTG